MKCLMIETQDKRRFFTYEKNYLQLIEFAKVFSAEICLVEIEEFPLLDLHELVPALCNANYKKNHPPITILEHKICHLSNWEEKKTRKIANQIQEYIMQTFVNGGIVNLKELKTKFATAKLTTACFCNHMRKAMKTLAQQGVETQKVGAGKYKVRLNKV